MSFRRHAGREKRPDRKGGRGSFRNQYRVPKGDVGSPIFFIAGEYPDPRPEERDALGRPTKKPYYISREHRKMVKGQKWPVTELCAAGWDPANLKPCVPCHERRQGDTSIDGKGGNPRSLFTLNMVHLVPYHLVPQVDGTTRQPRINPATNQPYLAKTACEGRGCQHCRDGADLLFGAKKYLQVGTNHLANLKQIDSDISGACLNCREGEVKTASFECPDCGHLIINCQDNDFSEDEIDQFAMEQLTCPKCRNTNILVETLECTHCQDPRRTTLFDVVLWLRRTGESTDSMLSIKHPSPKHFGWCWLDDFLVNDDPARPLVQPWPWKETEDGILVPEFEAEVAKMAKPYDFDDMPSVGKPRDPQGQAERLQIPNPFGAGQAPARDYGGGPPRSTSRI